MEGATAFDYRSRAELARKAQLDFRNYIAAARQSVQSTPNRETFAKWVEFQNSPVYQRLLTEFWMATNAACPPDFDDDFEALHSHNDMKALETAITFLEAHPFFFRSGYIKEKLLRYVRGYQLTPEYVARLQRVLLNVVDNHYCREFCEYRKLAHRIDSDYLRLGLQIRKSSEDQGARNRARWVLDWLEGLELGQSREISGSK